MDNGKVTFKFKVKALRDLNIFGTDIPEGKEFTMSTWHMNHPKDMKGYLVECAGHGMFNCQKVGEDVDIIELIEVNNGR